MKKIILIAVVLIIAFCLVLLVKGNTMREIRAEIEIEAPIEKVWKIVTDIDNWQEWSPIINQASGVASLGSKLSITMASEDGKGGKDGPKYTPVVTIFEEPKLFRWRAKMMSEFIFTNDKVFELEKTNSGTRIIHKELFKGMLIPLFWSKLNGHVPSMLKSMNKALKEKIEKNSD